MIYILLYLTPGKGPQSLNSWQIFDDFLAKFSIPYRTFWAITPKSMGIKKWNVHISKALQLSFLSLPKYFTFRCVLIPLIDRFVNGNKRFFCKIEIASITLWALTHDTEMAGNNNGYPRIGNRNVFLIIYIFHTPTSEEGPVILDFLTEFSRFCSKVWYTLPNVLDYNSPQNGS